MIDWFKTLSWFEQLLWIVSIVSTAIFFFKIISTFLSKEPDKKRLYIFSRFFEFKNISAFLSMFGWTSISGLNQGFTITLSLIIGVVSGLLLMTVMAALFFFIQKLKEQSGTVK